MARPLESGGDGLAAIVEQWLPASIPHTAKQDRLPMDRRLRICQLMHRSVD